MADLLETLRCSRSVGADSVWVKLLSSAKELAEMLSKVQAMAHTIQTLARRL